MHILICDDDAVFAARVETLVRDFFALRGLQVECTVCHSGEETLNCTPFVRQYGILFRKWGVFVCQRDNESTTELKR